MVAVNVRSSLLAVLVVGSTLLSAKNALAADACQEIPGLQANASRLQADIAKAQSTKNVALEKDLLRQQTALKARIESALTTCQHEHSTCVAKANVGSALPKMESDLQALEKNPKSAPKAKSDLKAAIDRAKAQIAVLEARCPAPPLAPVAKR